MARELERRWDEALRADEQLQADYARFGSVSPARLSPSELQQIESLSQDLPALWYAASTTSQDRQTIARTLLEQVTVTVEGDTDRFEVELRWAGGFVSRHALRRPVQTYEQLSNYQELVQRIHTLRAEGHTLSQIATRLNSEGFHPPKRTTQFTKGILCRFLREREVRAGKRVRTEPDQLCLKPNEWWLPDLAGQLSMPIATMHRWRRIGWVRARKLDEPRGRWAVYADADELGRLRRLRDARHHQPGPYPAELVNPKSNDD